MLGFDEFWKVCSFRTDGRITDRTVRCLDEPLSRGRGSGLLSPVSHVLGGYGLRQCWESFFLRTTVSAAESLLTITCLVLLLIGFDPDTLSKQPLGYIRPRPLFCNTTSWLPRIRLFPLHCTCGWNTTEAFFLSQGRV